MTTTVKITTSECAAQVFLMPLSSGVRDKDQKWIPGPVVKPHSAHEVHVHDGLEILVSELPEMVGTAVAKADE